MMPGVVAGFPSSPSAVAISITTAYDSADYGGYEADSRGSITPFGASAIPGAPAVPEAAGEILQIIYEKYEGFTDQLFVTVRGAYASAPFSSVMIGSLSVSGFSVYYGDSSQTSFRTRSISGNPIPAGTHALTFS